MKKSASIAGTILATSLLLGACGSSDTTDKDTPVVENDTTGTDDTSTETDTVTEESSDTEESTDSSSDASGDATSDQEYMNEQMDKLAYDEFELEVDYGKNQEYEIEIEQDNGMVEATLEDELSNQSLRGREAFDDIYPKLEKMDITETTSKDEAITQALDAFNLKDDYVTFELEMTMPDGQKMNFEDTK